MLAFCVFKSSAVTLGKVPVEPVANFCKLPAAIFIAMRVVIGVMLTVPAAVATE
jgi:hypothetical protein